MQTAAITKPPPRGVGTTCELRSFGTSSSPRSIDHRLNRETPKYVAENANMNIRVINKITFVCLVYSKFLNVFI